MCVAASHVGRVAFMAGIRDILHVLHVMRVPPAGMESDTWLTGYPRSQDPAPQKSVQSRLSLTALQFKPELYDTTTLVNTHENSTNREVEEHT